MKLVMTNRNILMIEYFLFLQIVDKLKLNCLCLLMMIYLNIDDTMIILRETELLFHERSFHTVQNRR